MFNKKLARRIQSLENTLGIAYCPDEKGSFMSDEHYVAEHGWLPRIKEFLDKKNK